MYFSDRTRKKRQQETTQKIAGGTKVYKQNCLPTASAASQFLMQPLFADWIWWIIQAHTSNMMKFKAVWLYQ